LNKIYFVSYHSWLSLSVFHLKERKKKKTMSSTWSDAIAKATPPGQLSPTDPVVFQPVTKHQVRVGIKGKNATLVPTSSLCEHGNAEIFYFVSLPDKAPFGLVIDNMNNFEIGIKTTCSGRVNEMVVIPPHAMHTIQRPTDVNLPFTFYENADSEEAKQAYADSKNQDNDLVEFKLYLPLNPPRNAVSVAPKTFGRGTNCGSMVMCTNPPDTFSSSLAGFGGGAGAGSAPAPPNTFSSSLSVGSSSAPVDKVSNGAIGLGSQITRQEFQDTFFAHQPDHAGVWYFRLISSELVPKGPTKPPKWGTQSMTILK